MGHLNRQRPLFAVLMTRKGQPGVSDFTLNFGAVRSSLTPYFLASYGPLRVETVVEWPGALCHNATSRHFFCLMSSGFGLSMTHFMTPARAPLLLPIPIRTHPA